MRQSKSVVGFTVIFLGILLQACAGHPTYEKGLRVRWADDAGSVTVAPIAVTPWDDVASELQPNFKMDSAAAYAAAIPTTQSLDERLADILSANIQAGLPTSNATNITRQVTNPETGELVTTVENARTRQSGSTPAPATAAASTAAALAALSAGNLGDDPMLRYLAATALQQEVALLNRYVRDRVQWPGSQAFVVRLQLSVMPNGRSLPYDVETDITLHPDDEQSRTGLALGLQDLGPPQTVAQRQERCAEGTHDTLNILPMIVTDNLEGLRAARSTDNIRQLALALVGTAGNVGLGGQFGRTTQELRRAEGRDTNSLFTVAKLSDDTVRVRLGAVQSPRYGYVMIPRTHNISLVVIFRPCPNLNRTRYEDSGPRALTAVTRTTFRDAENGRALDYRDATVRLYQQISDLRSRYVGQFNYLELARLFQWSSRQDHQRFFDYVVDQHLQASQCSPGVRGMVRRLGAGILGVNLYNILPHDYLELSEPTDYQLPPGTLERSRDNRDIRNSRQANEPVPRPYADRDARCLTLARIRYQTVAGPLWTELQSIRPAGQFAFTNIPVLLRSPRPTLPPHQIALINYSGTEGTVALPQGQDLAGLRNVQMTLIGAPLGPIAATETNISANGRMLTGKFPPLGRFGVTPPPAPGAVAAPAPGAAPAPAPAAAPEYRLEVTVPYDRVPPRPCSATPEGAAGQTAGPVPCVVSYPVRLHNAAAPLPVSPFTLTAPASRILADAQGRGRLNVIVGTSTPDGPPPANLYLSVDGADLTAIESIRGLTYAGDGRGWKITALGEAALSLSNLIANGTVRLTLRDGETSRTVEVTVIVPQPANTSRGSGQGQ